MTTESNRHTIRSEAFTDFARTLRDTPDLKPSLDGNTPRAVISQAVTAGMNDQKELIIELAERLAQIERYAAHMLTTDKEVTP